MAMDSISKYQELRKQTVPGLLFQRIKETPGEVAYRVKKLGIFWERTWQDLGERVGQCAAGLLSLGLGKGERVALIGDPCEEYVICELSAQSLGAVTYGLYPTSSQDEMRYLLEDGEACILVAENQEYVDRVLPILGDLPGLRQIIVIDTRGLFMYEHAALTSYDDLMKIGQAKGSSHTPSLEERIQDLKPSDDLFIVYTSGTTGKPKGAVISNGKHLAGAYTLIDRYPMLAEGRHRTVVLLPLCHVLGKNVAVTLPFLTRIVPHYGESMEVLDQTIFETAPTVLFTVPRFLQKFATRILVGIENTSPLKRFFYRQAVKIGRGHAASLWQGGKKNFWMWCLYFLCYQGVFRPILNKFGFDKLQLCFCGGAPISPEVTALWHIYGVNVSQFYGQTEGGGAIITAQGACFPRPGNVGRPPLGVEVKLSQKGEILVRCDDIFEGYLHNPELTAEVLDDEGWLHTGDAGEWLNDGNLRIIDRMKDIIVTAGGKTLSPTHIENTLKASPYISEAVVFGHNRKYLSALIEIEPETVSDWARIQNITYAGFDGLVENPEIIGLIEGEIEKANRELARVEQVKAFRVIPKLLNPEEDSKAVTATRKVKREHLYGMFTDLVESMYNDAEQRMVASEIGDLLSAKQ